MLPFSDTKPITCRKLDVDLLTLTPWRCTSCGSSGMASCSLFCTWTWAMSPSVPLSKVSLIVAMPLDDDCDEKYIRPSRPFMFCSMIWVTESSTTLAEAPG